MAISIRNPRVGELAREIGRIENRSMTDVIIEALEEKRDKVINSGAEKELRLKKISQIVEKLAELPVADDRGADEILGYDENGGF